MGFMLMVKSGVHDYCNLAHEYHQHTFYVHEHHLQISQRSEWDQWLMDNWLKLDELAIWFSHLQCSFHCQWYTAQRDGLGSLVMDNQVGTAAVPPSTYCKNIAPNPESAWLLQSMILTISFAQGTVPGNKNVGTWGGEKILACTVYSMDDYSGH